MEWPLVGRAGELGRLASLLTARTPRSVVLAGAPGVGKSRLATEAIAAAERAGMATLRIVATPAASALPFGALAPLLPPPEDTDTASSESRTVLLRQSASALVERAGDRRLVLLVDDAHLLDDASAAVIHQLAASGAASVLVTVRAGARAPAAVLALWKDDIAERIDVAGLSVEDIGELLAAVLGGPIDQATVLLLAVRCEGNALFLRELVLGALDDKTLVSEAGIWRVVGPLRPSTRLAEIIDSRLAGLRPGERALLELVAFADPLGSAELSALADRQLAEALERQGLLSSRVDGRRLEVELVHPLYGDVLRARLSALGARRLALELAEVVAATGARRRNDVLRIAVWRLDAGGADPGLLVAGAVEARRRFDFALAERLARAAVVAGAGFDAALVAAEMASRQGRAEDADRELEALVASASDDEQRARAALAQYENAGIALGDIDRARRLLEDAVRAIADPALRDEVAARGFAARLVNVGPSAVVEAFESLSARAGHSLTPWAFLPASYALGRVGRFEDALDTIERGRVSDPRGSTLACLWDAAAYGIMAHAGRLLEAEERASVSYDQALAQGAVEAQTCMAGVLASITVERGCVARAMHHARESVALARRLGRRPWEHDALQVLGLALGLAGRPLDAARVLAELDALHVRFALHRQVDVLRARAWSSAAAGDLPRARATLGEAAELGQQIGDLVGTSAAWHDVARLGHADDVAAGLADLAGRVEGDLATARAGHADALARDDPSRLEKVSIAFEQMGADLLAAEAAADAAVSWRRAGRQREAAAAEHRARSLVARCEGAATPALQTMDSRAMLTSAERETAVLAAAGRSNREIAEQLHLSVRTVENRLQHVYDKLGIAGRSELTASLRGSGSDAS